MIDTPSLLDIPWKSRTVQVVLLSTALAPLGVPLISPALPVFRDTFALTEAQASLLVSGYFLVGIVLSPFVGIFADRLSFWKLEGLQQAEIEGAPVKQYLGYKRYFARLPIQGA